MSYSPVGGESKANTVQLLDRRTLEPILQIESGAVAFSPDGRVICTAKRGILRRFDIQSGKLIDTLTVSDLAVRSISFSSDGNRLATAGADSGDVIVWNTTTTPFDRVARFHSDEYVNSVAWDATGTRLLATCDSTIRIWDATLLRDRVAARDARHQALAQVEPMVAKLFDELKEPTRVAERIGADAPLSPVARKTALRVVLRKGLEAQAAPREIQPGPLTAPK